MKIISLSEMYLIELFVTPLKIYIVKHSIHISKHTSKQFLTLTKNQQIKCRSQRTQNKKKKPMKTTQENY